MCTHQRYIYNKYIRKSILVNCGKCPACLQERANRRAERIRNNQSSGSVTLFVTLTYANDYIPFVYRDDFNDSDTEINIYRRCKIRFTYSKKYGYKIKKTPGIHVIDRVSCDKSILHSSDNARLKHLQGLSHDLIGVCYFEDIKRFFKRLRQILIRNYNYEGFFSYFVASELGSHTDRPHFHAAITIPIGCETIFRNAISQAWPFMFYGKSEKWFQIAKNAASYIASYVNSNTNILPAMSLPAFKPKFSSSKGFGVCLDCFKLSSLLSKIDRGDLHYYRTGKINGDSTATPLPIPEYVFSRYFPKFKGFAWVTTSQLCQLCLSPESAGFIFRDSVFDSPIKIAGNTYRYYVDSRPKLYNPIYHYSASETRAIAVKIENCYQKFHALTGLSRYDYFYYYSRVWCLLSLTAIKDSLTSVTRFDDWSDFYENVHEPGIFLVAPTLHGIDLQPDPNARLFVRSKTDKFSQMYDRMDKRKKVSNIVLSRLGYNV